MKDEIDYYQEGWMDALMWSIEMGHLNKEELIELMRGKFNEIHHDARDN